MIRWLASAGVAAGIAFSVVLGVRVAASPARPEGPRHPPEERAASTEPASSRPACVPIETLTPEVASDRLEALRALRADLERADEAASEYVRFGPEQVEAALAKIAADGVTLDMVDCSSHPCIARFLHEDPVPFEALLREQPAMEGALISGFTHPSVDERPSFTVIAIWDEPPGASERIAALPRLRAAGER